MGKRVKDQEEYRPVEHAALMSVLTEVLEEPASKTPPLRPAQHQQPVPNAEPATELPAELPGSVAEPERTVVPFRTEAASAPRSKTRRLDREKRFKVTDVEDVEIERIAAAFAAASGCKVRLSNLCRAFCVILEHGHEFLLHEAAEKGHLLGRRPQHADNIAMAEFDNRVAQVLLTAFKKMPPIA